jgi:6-phosphogluconolactonase
MPDGTHDWLMFVGTYTRTGRSKGIYVYRMNGNTGALDLAHTQEGISNPSFLAIHPNRRFLYAVAEVEESGGVPGGALTAYAIDAKTGSLKRMNHQTTGGPGPCHVSVDATGKYAIVANYGGGSVCVIPISDDGSLKPYSQFIQHQGGTKVNPRRQDKAHAHSINLDPANKRAVVNDLGMDRILVYDMDLDKGKLILNETASVDSAPGAGPRHFDYHPDGRHAYAINELGCTVTAYDFDSSSGKLSDIQSVSTLPDDFDGQNSTADIHVHPNGRFVYGSNRGHNSLAIYSIEQGTGRLTFVGHQSTGGKTPRNFAIHPDGRFLYAANQDTDNIVRFGIDAKTGGLTPQAEVSCPMPVCLKFMPVG